jgi:hypothetical protein
MRISAGRRGSSDRRGSLLPGGRRGANGDPTVEGFTLERLVGSRLHHRHDRDLILPIPGSWVVPPISTRDALIIISALRSACSGEKL